MAVVATSRLQPLFHFERLVILDEARPKPNFASKRVLPDPSSKVGQVGLLDQGLQMIYLLLPPLRS